MKKKKVSKPFTPEELSMLPSRHNAHQNPNLIIERNVYSLVEYPQLSTVKNKADLIFLDAEPVLFNSL